MTIRTSHADHGQMHRRDFRIVELYIGPDSGLLGEIAAITISKQSVWQRRANRGDVYTQCPIGQSPSIDKNTLLRRMSSDDQLRENVAVCPPIPNSCGIAACGALFAKALKWIMAPRSYAVRCFAATAILRSSSNMDKLVSQL